MKQNYDIVIIGGGAAGLAAALFGSRQGRSVAVITKDLGGQIATTYLVENYLGLPNKTGPELTDIFYGHVKKNGVDFHFEKAIELIKEGEAFTVQTESKTITGRTVILAFGRTPRTLDVAGEKELARKGVCYSTVSDGPAYFGKAVAVVGGGNSAVETALYLDPHCPKVYLIHRGDTFRAESIAQKRLALCKNVEVFFNHVVRRIEGDSIVERIVISPTASEHPEQTLEVAALFVNAGSGTNTTWIHGDLVEKTKLGEIVSDRDCRTKTSGLFAAGDITDISYKQIQISAGEGVKAVLQACKYLAEKEGKRMSFIDWS